MSLSRIDQMRQNYTLGGLSEQDVDSDPMVQFGNWFAEATEPGSASGIPPWLEPNAMTLSTSDPDGTVSSRIVLLKGVERNAFVFYSNYASHKASQISANAHVALCFYWPHLQRQVLVQGGAAKIDRERSLEYFRSRPRDSQLGAHASTQSSVIASREVLEQRMDELRRRYPGETEIPLPENWGGYAVVPSWIEFWQGRTSRLHDRIVYRNENDAWTIERLSP
ncbi:pyridoxamine 5'-phosphate oxidase [Neorhodopirellula pilleata]|nr:pyridoxamine 5'-phosphate oxidase [Neorhodopirellula pilleata]